MSAKRLAILVVPVLILVANALAQLNTVSITAGRAFVSTQTVVNPPPGDLDPRIHFANEEAFAFNYSRMLKSFGLFGLSAELPVAVYPRMDLNTFANSIPKDIGAVFVTPSVRMNIFSADSFTPWVSFGGGYAHFREASTLNFFGANPGPTGSNTGVLQFGTGLDVWVWSRWGARFEARDFYSGKPELNVQTSNSRQHNYYVGLGVVHRF